MNALAIIVALGLFVGCAPRSPSPGMAGVEPQGATIRLTLRSSERTFPLSLARTGDVSVIARFENLAKTTILLAHPGVCVPRRPEEGESIRVDPGLSELSLRIETPAGEVRRLRHGPVSFFAPHNRDHLKIAPGTFEEAHFGRMGPEFSLSPWEKIDRPIFDAPGTYRLTLSYRNAQPLAAIHDSQGEISWVQAWTGTLESNRLDVEIE